MKAASFVKQYFDEYIQNKIQNSSLLSKEIHLDFSTIGTSDGIDKAKALLSLPGDFTYRYNIISNLIEYSKDDDEIIICNAFHFMIKEEFSYNVKSATSSVNGTVYPFVWGGKYKFCIQAGIITSIAFDLEAQMGNTYWAKKNYHWHLYDETKNEPRHVLLDGKHTLMLSDEDEINARIKEFMLIIDTRQVNLYSDYVSKDAIYSYRDSTRQGMGVSSDSRVKVDIGDLVKHIGDREMQSHHSYRLISINIEDHHAEAIVEMFEPTKLGYKHLYANNVYQPYYNEQWKIKLVKEDQWKIQLADRTAISKFQKISYDSLFI